MKSDWQFAFVVMLIANIAVNNLFDELKKHSPESTWGMRAIVVTIVMGFNLVVAAIVATIYAAVRAW